MENKVSLIFMCKKCKTWCPSSPREKEILMEGWESDDMFDKLKFPIRQRENYTVNYRFTYTKAAICNSVSQVGAKTHQICSK